MDSLIIYISWEYFLGIIGALIGIAYYANGRLTKLETSVEWLAEAVRELRTQFENGARKLFNPGSPIKLTRVGRRILERSGMKSYVDTHKEELLGLCKDQADSYSFQGAAFHLFEGLRFDERDARQLRQAAHATGLSIEILRRAGAIYFCEIVDQSHGASTSDPFSFGDHESI
jgi:hypothetical protein